MTSLRKRRIRVHRLHQAVLCARLESILEDEWWDRMAPVGREFGSPDFERLMAEDSRLGRGVFDPAVRWSFESETEHRAALDFSDEPPLRAKTSD